MDTIYILFFIDNKFIKYRLKSTRTRFGLTSPDLDSILKELSKALQGRD